jgi:hypothetical protein
VAVGWAVSGATMLLLLIAVDGRRRARLEYAGPAAHASGLFQGDRRCSLP